jgi:GNAT superfamily N-acetyltransferase
VFKPALRFRKATHDDAPFAAAVIAAVDSDHPQSAGDVLEQWINTERTSVVRRFVVQEDGQDRAWFSLVQPGDVGGRVTYLNLLFPVAQRHLLPAAIDFGESQARQMGAPMLICEVREDVEHAIEWLRGAGWSLERRERFWRLDLRTGGDRIRELRNDARRRLERTGVAIKSVAELGGEAFFRRLHPVSVATVADIPMSVEYVPEPYEDWVVWLRPPAVLPERVWVAVLDGDPVGYSFLAYRESVVETSYTGVLREHRGQGIARALKLETLVQAIDLGVAAVETDNDSENAPILHLNEELGYQELPGELAFHLKLS